MSERYNVTLRGIAPVTFNRPMIDSEPGGKGKSASQSTGESRRLEAMERMYRAPDGTIIWPSLAIDQLMEEGAKAGNVKVGRKSAAYILKATVAPTDGSFGVADPDQIVEMTVRVPPRTGAIIWKAWPQLDTGWRLTFDLEFLQSSILSPNVARSCLETAGILVGMGTMRPREGRFVIESWEKQ